MKVPSAAKLVPAASVFIVFLIIVSVQVYSTPKPELSDELYFSLADSYDGSAPTSTVVEVETTTKRDGFTHVQEKTTTKSYEDTKTPNKTTLNTDSVFTELRNKTTEGDETMRVLHNEMTTSYDFMEVPDNITAISDVSANGSSTNCETVLSTVTNVTQSEYIIQVIAATPGSGSDWSVISLPLLTGYCVGSVYHLIKLKDIRQIPYLPLYYKTHFPFIPSVGPIDDYINLNPERVVVLIRDPFDAAFSEWIRQKVHEAKPNDEKYSSLAQLIGRKDFLKQTEENGIQPSAGFIDHFNRYLNNWRNFHRYWLSDFSGEVKVVLYQQLVDDILRFKEIASFFGYETDSTTERKERLQCFLNNVEKTKYRKRPFSASIEETKDVVRKYFESKTKDARDYVEMLYKLKYNHTLVIP